MRPRWYNNCFARLLTCSVPPGKPSLYFILHRRLISLTSSLSIHQDTAIKLHEEQLFVQPHFNITTEPSSCHRFSKLPAELQLEVWKHAAAPEGEVDADASHPRNFHRRPHCSISAMLLVITGGSQAGRARWDASQPSRSHFKGTAENILRFTQVYMTRDSMMASCKVARFVAIEA